MPEILRWCVRVTSSHLLHQPPLLLIQPSLQMLLPPFLSQNSSQNLSEASVRQTQVSMFPISPVSSQTKNSVSVSSTTMPQQELSPMLSSLTLSQQDSRELIAQPKTASLLLVLLSSVVMRQVCEELSKTTDGQEIIFLSHHRQDSME